MKSVKIGTNNFTYDDVGDGPVILLLSGWCQDHRLFDSLVPELTGTHRVIRVDWRGHGKDRNYDGDFNADDMVRDTVAFIDELGIRELLPLSTSHGGWINVEIAEQLGKDRIPRIILIDWIMTQPATAFFDSLADVQDEQKWRKGINDLFQYWISDTNDRRVINHVRNEMAGFDFDMWARSGREIAAAYKRWGTVLERLTSLTNSRPITHIFSQPFEQSYHDAQISFASTNAWFSPVKLPGKTHFPTLEQPENVAAAIRYFCATPFALD